MLQLATECDKFLAMVLDRSTAFSLGQIANIHGHAPRYFIVLYISFSAFRDRPYREFLQSQRLGMKIQNFIIYSIAMVDDSTNTLMGLSATQKFLKSLGRYGNSAFLWPMYGIGELPQAFCRFALFKPYSTQGGGIAP